VLVDTNLLVRTLQPHHPPYALADGAIAALRSQNKKLFLMPQNLVELRRRFGDVHRGRPNRNRAARRLFTVPSESPAIYSIWKRLGIPASRLCTPTTSLLRHDVAALFGSRRFSTGPLFPRLAGALCHALRQVIHNLRLVARHLIIGILQQLVFAVEERLANVLLHARIVQLTLPGRFL